MDLKEKDSRMSELFSQVHQKGQDSGVNGMVSSATASYAKSKGKNMSKMQQAILQNTLAENVNKMIQGGVSKQAIMSASADLSQLDNPITLKLALLNIIVPTLVYKDIIGMQPMPTKTSPVIIPEIIAGETRNGVTKGDRLLGAANWNQNNNYSANKDVLSGTLAASTSQSISITGISATHSIIPGTVKIRLVIASLGTVVVRDDKNGAFPAVTGVLTAGTVNYTTGAISLTLASAAVATDTYSLEYRYKDDAQTPALAEFVFTDKAVTAYPRRLRTSFSLDDLYAAKKVLDGFDLEKIYSENVGGYIQKEVSGGVLDDIKNMASADYAWAGSMTNVAWALHRLSAYETIRTMANDIKKNVQRSAGNRFICGAKMSTLIETLGDDIFKAKSYGSGQPIGPYHLGTLGGDIEVYKNLDYESDVSVMCFKSDDVSASVVGGSFIDLYWTNPVQMDDLRQIQGMGMQFGFEQIFDNSICTMTIV